MPTTKRIECRKIFKLAILGSHPIQYFSPLYKRLALEENIDLTVYYCSRQGVDEYQDIGLGITLQWDIPLLDGYNYKFLPDIWGNVPSMFTPRMLQLAIFNEIVHGGYDALWIYGYQHPTYLLAIAAAKMSKTALLIRTESHLKLARLQQRTMMNKIRPSILKLIHKLFDGALAIGANNAEHYRALGMADDKIFFVPFTVDNELFMSNNKWDESEIRSTRQELGIPLNMPGILFVGKLIPKKEPLVLLKAFCQMQRKLNRPAALVYVGEGELRAELERYCLENNVKDVVFAGFVNQSNINKYYAVANIFVLPSSEETWGLVLNEAMCAKNAVIVSNAVGATADLVLPGENGFTFPVGDVDALTAHLTTLVSDTELCQRMGERSLNIISQWSFEEDVSGIRLALSQSMRNKSHDVSRKQSG